MMPKGVEHQDHLTHARDFLDVKIPMMPKGVEHSQMACASSAFICREDSYDAERR